MSNLAQISPAPLPTPPPRSGGLGEKIFNAFTAGLVTATNAVRDTLSNIIRMGVELVMESIERAAAPQLTPILNMILRTPDLPQEIRQYLEHLKNPTAQADAIGLSGLATSTAAGAAGAMLAPIFRTINYSMDNVLHTNRPDLSLALATHWRVPASEAEMRKSLADTGWAPSYVPWLEETIRPRLDPNSLIIWARRQGLDPNSIRNEILKFGYEAAEVDRLIKLSEQLPSPADIITLAVREAFNDQFAAQTGADSDFPSEVAEWSERQGLSADWARKYWRAHWQLPSPQMGFEMLHRGVISESDLAALLKALDYAPAWRDKLKAISYNPYTRVDVRRMFNLGILNREGVKRSYLDQGYDNEHAENLTVFTVKDATGTDKELTKADVLSGYSSGILSKAEAREWLVNLDYPADLADFYLLREDTKKADSRKNKKLAVVKKLYVGSDITTAEAATRMSGLGIVGAEMSELLDDWAIEREAKTERPSGAQLETLLKQDIITEGQYRDGLKQLGFQTQYIEMLTASVLAEKADAARKLALAARAEQERLRTARLKSQYAVDKSQSDVDEAELQTAIAETQVAASARTLRYQSEVTIAKQKVSAAQLEQAAQQDLADLQSQIDDRTSAAAVLQEIVQAEQEAIADIHLIIAEKTIALNTALAALTDKVEISDAKAAFKAETLELNRQIAEHNVISEQTQSDLALNQSHIVDLRGQIDARHAKLQADLGIAQRIKSVADVESEYRRDQLTSSAALGELRTNLAVLREEKAKLASALRASLKGT